MSAEFLNPVRGIRGMAVTPHALASQSALAILRDGGKIARTYRPDFARSADYRIRYDLFRETCLR